MKLCLFMFFIRVTILIFSLTLFHFVALGRDLIQENNYVGKTFWLKYPLIFWGNGSPPKIYSNDIIFTDQCKVDPYAGRILRRETEIKITSLVTQKGFTTVTFNAEKETFSIQVYGLSFSKSFNLLFATSNKDSAIPCSGALKTKKQVIDCMGYPISRCKEGKVEKLFYILEFSAWSSIYDGWWITLQNGKVVDIGGYI